jgi:hypothetical protein
MKLYAIVGRELLYMCVLIQYSTYVCNTLPNQYFTNQTQYIHMYVACYMQLYVMSFRVCNTLSNQLSLIDVKHSMYMRCKPLEGTELCVHKKETCNHVCTYVHQKQGDLMSLSQNRTKCGQSYFLLKLIYNLRHG